MPIYINIYVIVCSRTVLRGLLYLLRVSIYVACACNQYIDIYLYIYMYKLIMYLLYIIV